MNEQFEKVKRHLSKNRWIYLSSGIAIAAAGTGGYLLGSSGKIAPNQQAFLNYKSAITQTQITMTTARGHRGNQVLHDQSGIIYPSQNVAADALGISRSTLSDHLTGKKPHANGQTFTNLGEDLRSR